MPTLPKRWFWGEHLENSPVHLQLHHQGLQWVQLHLPGVWYGWAVQSLSSCKICSWKTWATTAWLWGGRGALVCWARRAPGEAPGRGSWRGTLEDLSKAGGSPEMGGHLAALPTLPPSFSPFLHPSLCPSLPGVTCNISKSPTEVPLLPRIRTHRQVRRSIPASHQDFKKEQN